MSAVVAENKQWRWPAMAVVVLAMTAGWWLTRPQPLPPPAATVLGWQAQAWWLAGDGHPGLQDGPARQGHTDVAQFHAHRASVPAACSSDRIPMPSAPNALAHLPRNGNAAQAQEIGKRTQP